MSETLSVFRPGDVIEDVGTVAETVTNLPWPSDVYGNMYFGCVLANNRLCDAHTGHVLGAEAMEMRRNNLAFNYNEAYKPRKSTETVYRTMTAKCLLNTAMDTEAHEKGEKPDLNRWDGLEEDERRRYVELAMKRMGIGYEQFPVEEMEFVNNLVRKVRPATAAELARRRVSRVKVEDLMKASGSRGGDGQ